MTDLFLNAHAGWQYVALAAVVISAAISFTATMTTVKERIYRLSAVVVDIQVAFGIVIWLSNSGWSLGFMQGWLHPVLGLGAAGVLHAFVNRARASDVDDRNKIVRIGLILATVLVVAAIGIAEAA